MKRLPLILFIAFIIGCAHQGSREIAAIERAHQIELWQRSLKEHQGPGIKLSEHSLENLYLSSYDEEDFMEHLLKMNLASDFHDENDYHQLTAKLLNLRKDLLKIKATKKAQNVSSLLFLLAAKVEESSLAQYGK